MGSLQSGLKTTFLSALTTVETDIATFGTDYAALITAHTALKTTDDGSVWLGGHGKLMPGGVYDPSGTVRLDDVLSQKMLARTIADRMNAAGLRLVLQAWADQQPEGSGTAALVTLVTAILSGR